MVVVLVLGLGGLVVAVLLGHLGLLRSLGVAGLLGPRYDPSRWLALSTALHGLQTGPEDVFADLGSGKGRVVIQAARRYPFKRVIGVELSDELTRVARANRDRQRRLRCPSVEFVTADLTRWEMASNLTLAYMYNPLQGATFSAAVQRLLAGRCERTAPAADAAVRQSGRARSPDGYRTDRAARAAAGNTAAPGRPAGRQPL